MLRPCDCGTLLDRSLVSLSRLAPSGMDMVAFSQPKDHVTEIRLGERYNQKFSFMIPYFGSCMVHAGHRFILQLNLVQGVVYWQPPAQALDKVKELVWEPSTSRYGADEGLPELRHALIEKVRQCSLQLENSLFPANSRIGLFDSLTRFMFHALSCYVVMDLFLEDNRNSCLLNPKFQVTNENNL